MTRVACHIEYAYHSRSRGVAHGGNHIVVDTRLDHGRLHRAPKDALCKPAAKFWQLDDGLAVTTPEPSCVACIAYYGRLVAAGILAPHEGRTVRWRYDVRSDGRTVWVDVDTGFTVARFGPMGIDVHTPDTTGCLDCTHGPTGPEHWDRFVASVRDHYGIVVPDVHRPTYCHEGTPS